MQEMPEIIPGLEKSPGVGNGQPVQYSCVCVYVHFKTTLDYAHGFNG